MKYTFIFVILLLLALNACSPAQETPTLQQPFVTATPTLFLGSPVAPLDTPAPGSETAISEPATSEPVPFPSFTPLSQPTQPTPGGISATYAVILVPEGDQLNIRSGPGVSNAVTGSLEPSASGIVRTGKTTQAGEDLWVEIQNPGGGTGWVDSKFLTEEVTSSAFCSDTRVAAMIQELASAVKAGNDDMLAALVHSRHGLDARLWRYGTVANYTPDEASWMFESKYEVNWGAAPGSGENTLGTFSEALLPRLQEVFSTNYTTHCNDLLDLPTFSVQPWPIEYSNINFYLVYKPGSEQYGGLDWRAWAVGFEYVEGKPYLFSLIHYQWEP